MPDQNSMIYWLAYVCRTARVNAEPKLKHVEIAVAARQFAARRAAVDQSTVSRFEKGATWPRNADVIVAAYADELRRRGHDVEASDLWAEALRLWQAHLAGDDVSEVDRRVLDAALHAEDELRDDTPDDGDRGHTPRRRRPS